MDNLLGALAAHGDVPLALKRRSVRHVAKTIPSQPAEIVPKLLAISLQWIDPSASRVAAPMRQSGYILLRALSLHPRMELLLPPGFALQLTRSFGRRAVPLLAALSPVLARTPAQTLASDAKRVVTAAIVEYLAMRPAETGTEVEAASTRGSGKAGQDRRLERWSVGRLRSVTGAVLVAHWVVEHDPTALDGLLIDVFTCLCDPQGNKPKPSSSQGASAAHAAMFSGGGGGGNTWTTEPDPALGLLVGSLLPSHASKLEPFIRSIGSALPDRALTNCVCIISRWPLGIPVRSYSSRSVPDWNNAAEPDGGNHEREGVEEEEEEEEDVASSYEDDRTFLRRMVELARGRGWSVLGAPHTAAWVMAFLAALGATHRHAALVAAVPAAATAASSRAAAHLHRLAFPPLPHRALSSVGSSGGNVLRDAKGQQKQKEKGVCSGESRPGIIGKEAEKESAALEIEDQEDQEHATAAALCLELLEQLLLGYQHAPDAFHQVLRSLEDCHRELEARATLPTPPTVRPVPPNAKTTPKPRTTSPPTAPDTSAGNGGLSGEPADSVAVWASLVLRFTPTRPNLSLTRSPSSSTTSSSSSSTTSSSSSTASSSPLALSLRRVYQVLRRLTHTQMLLHPGHPHLYEKPWLVALPPPPSLSDEEGARVHGEGRPSMAAVERIVAQAQGSAWLAESSAMNLLRTSTSATATLANEPPHSSPMPSSAGGGSAPLRRPHLPLGLRNIGNTCYLNSVLQMLAGNADVRALLLRAKKKQTAKPPKGPACESKRDASSKKPPGEQTSRPMMARASVESKGGAGSVESKAHGMVRELRRLLAVLRSGGRSERWPAMAPRDLHRCLPEPFNSTTQQDAAELLRFLIDGLEAGGYASSAPASEGDEEVNQSGGSEKREEATGVRNQKSKAEEIVPAEVARQKREGDSLVDMELPAPLLTCTECQEATSKRQRVGDQAKCPLEPPRRRRLESVEDIFGGRLETRTRCHRCNAVSTRPEPFSDLCLPIVSSSATSSPQQRSRGSMPHHSLPELIDEILQPEVLSAANGNAYVCESETCRKGANERRSVSGDGSQSEAAPEEHSRTSSATRRTVLVQPPKHLVATLNRFQYDSSTQRRTKLLSSVSFPRLLWLPVEEASATLPRTTSIAPDERAGSDGDASDGGACSAADEPAETEEKKPLRSAVAAAEEKKSGDEDGVDQRESTCEKSSSCGGSGSSAVHGTGVRSLKKSEVQEKTFVSYALYGIVVHAGSSAQSGHYYAYGRDSSSSGGASNSARSSWFLFNDQTVASVADERIEQIANGTNRNQHDTPYMLFYARVPSGETTKGSNSQRAARDGPRDDTHRSVGADLGVTAHDDSDRNDRKELKVAASAVADVELGGADASSKGGDEAPDDFDPALLEFLRADNANFLQEQAHGQQAASRSSRASDSQRDNRGGGSNGGEGGGGAGGAGGFDAPFGFGGGGGGHYVC